MPRITPALLLLGMLAGPISAAAADAPPVKKYFAHAIVEDHDGVIAPWYRGQNGQLDFRVRIAAETLKRYPWAEKPATVMAAPHFVFNSSWGIQPDGTIGINPHLDDWMNADSRPAVDQHPAGIYRVLSLHGRSGGHRRHHLDYRLPAGLLPDPGRSPLAALHH